MRTLRTQLLSATLLLLSLSLIVMGLWLVGEFHSYYVETVRQALERQGNLAELLVRGRFEEQNLDSLAREVAAATSLRTTIILPDGRVVGETERSPLELENHYDRPEVQEALAGRIGFDTRQSRTTGASMLYVAIPSLGVTGRIAGVVRLALDLTQIDRAFARIRLLALVGGSIALLFGAFLALLTARGISWPLERMAEVARGLAAGDFGHRASEVGPLETRELARAFNSMAGNLEEQFSKVRVTADRLAVVLESMRDGVLLMDGGGNIELANPAAEEMLGFPSGKLAGQPKTILSRHAELSERIAQAYRERQATIERITLGGSGAPRHMRVGVLHMGSRQVLITLQDLTEVYRALDVRREFVANVSHELRTPLTSLGLMVENMINGALDERPIAEDFLRRMQGEIQRLTKMVLELLQLSRLESRSEELEQAYFPVLPLLNEINDEFIDMLALKNLRLTFSGDLAAGIVGDRGKIKQVIINLLDNAARFSPEGETIIVGVVEHRRDLEFYIRDHGPGVAPEHLPRVYERFFKASSSRGGGTGLGLAIVKHIVEAHGGSVYARSKLGQGATFGVHIPKHPAT
jgi:two-component system phosphate regulon sensor histidine kinase PhoR